jgi:hypothetical protein
LAQSASLEPFLKVGWLFCYTFFKSVFLAQSASLEPFLKVGWLFCYTFFKSVFLAQPFLKVA